MKKNLVKNGIFPDRFSGLFRTVSPSTVGRLPWTRTDAKDLGVEKYAVAEIRRGRRQKTIWKKHELRAKLVTGTPICQGVNTYICILITRVCMFFFFYYY